MQFLNTCKVKYYMPCCKICFSVLLIIRVCPVGGCIIISTAVLCISAVNANSFNLNTRNILKIYYYKLIRLCLNIKTIRCGKCLIDRIIHTIYCNVDCRIRTHSCSIYENFTASICRVNNIISRMCCHVSRS